MATTGHIEFEVWVDGSVEISTYIMDDADRRYVQTGLVEDDHHHVEFSVLCCNDEAYSELTPGVRLRVHILHAETVDASDPRTVCGSIDVPLDRSEMVALRDYLTYLLSNPLEIE